MELTPFIIGVYFERDNIEPFRSRHTNRGPMASGGSSHADIITIICDIRRYTRNKIITIHA